MGRKRSKNKGPPRPSWEVFLAKYSGHPFLAVDAVYALPIALVEAIEKEAPRLWSKEEADFEAELAVLPGAGFFLGRPFFHELLPSNVPVLEEPTWSDLKKRDEQATEMLKRLLTEEIEETGRAPLVAERQHEEAAEFQQLVSDRQRGYLGWLITDPLFQREKAALCNEWSAAVRELGAVPSIQTHVGLGDPAPIPEEHRMLHAMHWDFFQKWNLETLSTFELPVPLRAELASSTEYVLRDIDGAGLLLFIPWFMFADRKLKLHDLANHQLKTGVADRLNPWLDGSDRFGATRYADLLDLYVYGELALKQRYGRRLEKLQKKLDAAFGRAFKPKKGGGGITARVESIRKIRRHLNRRLEDCRRMLTQD